MESKDGHVEGIVDPAESLAMLERAQAAAQSQSFDEMPAWVPVSLATVVTCIVAGSYAGPLGQSPWALPAFVVLSVCPCFMDRSSNGFVPRPNRLHAFVLLAVVGVVIVGIVFCWTLFQALTAPAGILAWIQLFIGWVVLYGFFTWVGGRLDDRRRRLWNVAHVAE